MPHKELFPNTTPDTAHYKSLSVAYNFANFALAEILHVDCLPHAECFWNVSAKMLHLFLRMRLAKICHPGLKTLSSSPELTTISRRRPSASLLLHRDLKKELVRAAKFSKTPFALEHTPAQACRG